MRYVYRNGKVIEADQAEPVSKPWATGVISDSMEPTRHHGTGQIHTSKAKFRADTRASGCVEIGNESMPQRQPAKLDKRQRRDDIRRAIYDLRNGHKPPQLVSDD